MRDEKFHQEAKEFSNMLKNRIAATHRDIFTWGGAPYMHGGKPPTWLIRKRHQDYTRKSKYKARRGDGARLLLKGLKDSREYAAKLKRKDPKKFDLWFKTGRVV